MSCITVFVTCANRKEADRIANALVKEKLTACANVMTGVNSTYWWKGKIEKSKEVLLTVKTVKGNFKRTVKRVKELHSYEVPEIIALPIICGSKDYLEWISNSVQRRAYSV